MHQKNIRHLTKFVNSLRTEKSSTELYYSDEECQQFFESIQNNPLSKKHFYLAIYLPTSEISFQYYLSDFLGLKYHVTLLDFLDHIHPNYKNSFLHWAKSAYLTVANERSLLNILDNSYKIIVPLRNLNGDYYWVLQESYALQIDEHQQLISQFNTYTIIGKYKMPQEILGWISTNLEVNIEKSAVLNHFYNQISNFKLSVTEKKLLILLRESPHLQYKEIGEQWNVKEDTIKKHAQQIIYKAKTAFSSYFIKNEKTTLKDIINYFNQLDFNF